MARFFLLCIILAELTTLIAKTNGSENMDLMAPKEVNGPYDKVVFEDELVPSPAPSSGGTGNRFVIRHHSSDKSAAGGDVILGGFATALIAAILCYIRVTRRNQETKTVE